MNIYQSMLKKKKLMLSCKTGNCLHKKLTISYSGCFCVWQQSPVAFSFLFCHTLNVENCYRINRTCFSSSRLIKFDWEISFINPWQLAVETLFFPKLHIYFSILTTVTVHWYLLMTFWKQWMFLSVLIKFSNKIWIDWQESVNYPTLGLFH